MKRFWLKFWLDESGATAIEYGLIAAGITVAILGTMQQLSKTVQTVLWEVVAATVSP